MKPTIIYLPEEAEQELQKLASKTGKSIPELIQEVIVDHFTPNSQKLPRSIGIGASGRSDLSAKTEQLLWTDE